MKQFLSAILIFSAVLFPQLAMATRDVSSPVVNEGQLRYEGRFGLEFDDHGNRDERLRQSHLVQYGFNDWYAMRVLGRWSKEQGDSNDFTALEWEHRVQLIHEDKYGWDGGFKAVYYWAENAGEPDVAEIDLLAQKKMGKMRYRGNAIFEHEVGSYAEDGLIFLLAWQAMHLTNDEWNIGVEGFHDIGRLKEQNGLSKQGHQIGPVVNYMPWDNTTFEIGYLTSLTPEASDHLVKFFIKQDF